MADEPKTISIKADDKTYERFIAISNVEFGDQGQCLASLINTYEIEKSKKIIPDRKLEIENFQAYINKLMEMFIMSLELNKDTQNKVRGEFDSLLKSKDLNISSLHEEIKNLTTRRKDLVDQMSLLEKKNQNIEKEISESTKIIEDYEKSIKSKDMLINNLKAKLEETKSAIESHKKDLNELETLKKKMYSVSFDNERYKAEIDKLNYELEKAKGKYEIERDKMLLEKGMDRQEEIDKYQNKIEELLLKLERKSYIEND